MQEKVENRKYNLLMFMPFVLISLIVYVSTFIVAEYETIKVLASTSFTDMKQLEEKLLSVIMTDNCLRLVNILYAVISVVVFGLMYYHFRKRDSRNNPVQYEKKANLSMLVVAALVTIIALVFFSEIVSFFIKMVLPQWYVDYSMNVASGAFSDVKNPATIVYAVILAPIVEELAFRGLTFLYAKKVNSTLMAMIYSTLLYLLFIGDKYEAVVLAATSIVFVYVMDKYDNIILVILMHMGCNALGLLPISDWLKFSIKEAPLVMFTEILGGMVTLYLSIFLLKKAAPVKKIEKASEI